MNMTLPRSRATTAVFAGLFLSLSLSACSSAVKQAAPTTTAPVVMESVAAAPEIILDSNLPIDALPEIPEGRNGFVECPYLDSQWLANTNGQRMTGQGIDTRFDTPACVFWSYPEEPQATVIVRHMPTEQAAIDVVDWAAPIDSTEPVDDGEWQGGRIGNHEGALYAVQKGTVAVVVFTNQDQSVKAELIGKEVIKNLSL